MKFFNLKILIIATFALFGLLTNMQNVSAASSQWFHCKYEKISFSAVKKGAMIAYPSGGGTIAVSTADDLRDLIGAWYEEINNASDVICEAFSFDTDSCANDFGCPFGTSCGPDSKCAQDATMFVCPNISGVCKKDVSQECICTKETGNNINCKSVFCGSDINYSCFNNKCQPAEAPKTYELGPGPGSSEIAECAVPNEMLPALPMSVSDAMSFWQGKYPGAKCIKSEKNFLECQTSDDCAIGSFCYADMVTGNKQCMLMATGIDGCKTDADCQSDFAMGNGSETKKIAYHCDTTTGICLYKINGECDCPYGDSPAIKGYCNSPFCPIVGKFGEAGSLGCSSKLNKCEKLSTAPVEICKDHLNCWEGSGGVVSPKTKCCVGGACTGNIMDCKDAFADQKKCPPFFAFLEGVANKDGTWSKKPSCSTECPIGVSALACEKDFDCAGVKVNLKSGETVGATCLSFDDIDTTELTYSTELLNKCREIGIEKMCHAAEVGGATPAAEIPLQPQMPDASVLNKLESTDISTIIGNAIKALMGLIGSIALAMFVYGGVLWMSSAGNAERSKKGMQVIVWAALGIFMILASYAVVNFVFEAFR